MEICCGFALIIRGGGDAAAGVPYFRRVESEKYAFLLPVTFVVTCALW
jgi:hypothetical protein